MSWKAKTLSVQGIIDNIEFFKEGWTMITRPECARDVFSWDGFLKTLLHVASLDECNGAVILFTSCNDKPLGFYVLCDNTEIFSDHRTVLIFAGYSNGKYEQAPLASIDFVEKWARDRGFKEIHAHTRRMTGAAARLYERKLGFTRLSWAFKKELQ